MNKKVEINIEELVLHGFAPGDGYRIGQAIELELERLFAERGIPGLLSETRNTGQLKAGTINIPANSTAESIGIQTAKSVYKGFKP